MYTFEFDLLHIRAHILSSFMASMTSIDSICILEKILLQKYDIGYFWTLITTLIRYSV